jgi:hypothetical protein
MRTPASRAKKPSDAGARRRKKKIARAPTVGRDPVTGMFMRGFSGNPAGSKIVVPEAVREAALNLSVEAIHRLGFWMRSNDPQASIMASKILLDRGLGKTAMPLAGPGASLSITFNSSAIVNADDAAAAYAAICGNPNADISGLTFAAPERSTSVECPVLPAIEPQAPHVTEREERQRLWSRLGEEK